MSFDLDIITHDVDGNEIIHEVVCGHTYNLTPMWAKALPSINGTTSSLDGRICRELEAELAAGAQHIFDNIEEYVELSPENGWGDFPGFFEIFVRFKEMCRLYPSGVVSWDG